MSEENFNGQVAGEQTVEPQNTYEQPVQPQQNYEQPQYQQPQQQYGQPQYQQPQQQYGQPQYQQPQGKGMAIASMVLGIIALVIFCVWYISIPCAIVGIVLGALFLRKGQKSAMATAGIACSIISLALLAVLFIYYIIVAGTAYSSFWYNFY